MADESNPLVRIVNTNDMQTAAQRFANLVDATDIDENTPSYTWSNADIDTMTYTRGGTSDNWATVDVNIKAVPSLQKIVYRVGGDGENRAFPGKAYYRFGDVVKRTVPVTYNEKKNNDRRGSIDEYWICVRPSFGPEKKEDSHWVCVNTVGDKNYKYYKASNNHEYWLPDNLSSDKENMQNFAELLWAISYPTVWYDNASNHHKDGWLWGYSGLPIFTDFKGANLKYHNANFWKNVQKGWIDAQVAENALNLPNFKALSDSIKSHGLHLIYDSYSWWTLTSWDCTLKEAVFTNGTKNDELNLHNAYYHKVEKEMKYLEFDVRHMGQDFDNYKRFFDYDGKHRWVIRHATGKELSDNKQYNVKDPIHGVTEVYRYYRDVVPTTNLDQAPEESVVKLATPVVGCVLTKEGHFYENATSATSATSNNEEPIAMVVYLAGNKLVEHPSDYNGLAIALKDYNNGEKLAFGNENDLCGSNAPTREYLPTLLNGNDYTFEMAYEGPHTHPAADAVNSLRSVNDNIMSKWFIPSSGQWCLAMEGMGFGKYVPEGGEDNNGEKLYKFEQQGEWLWDQAGLSEYKLLDNELYMTTTECNHSYTDEVTGEVWIFVNKADGQSNFRTEFKSAKCKVRPFIAFKYGNGGVFEVNQPWEEIDDPVVLGVIDNDGNYRRKAGDAFAATGYAPAALILYVDQGENKTVKVGGKDYRGFAVALTDISDDDNQFLGKDWSKR